MADDPRSRLPILKRFANLDIDGVGLVRKKPQKSAQAEQRSPVVARPVQRAEVSRQDAGVDPDLAALERLGEELNENARASRLAASPQARRSERANAIRASRAPDPRPVSPRAPQRPEERYRPDRVERRMVDAVALDLDLPRELSSGGVVSVEIDLSRGRRGGVEMRFDARQMPGPASSEGPLWDLPRSAPSRFSDPAEPPRPGVNAFTDGWGGTQAQNRAPIQAARPARAERSAPIELTPLAARQILLMAWEAGVPGSPLRILASHTPGLGWPEIDFAFDEEITPEDVVVEASGVTVVIGPESLEHVRGRRITWHDVPGSEGFSLR